MRTDTASATVLCETASCEALKPAIYPQNTSLTASLQASTQVKFITNLGTMACSGSAIAGKTTAEKGEPLPIEVSELSFSSCAFGKTACTGTTTALPTSPSLKATGEGGGTLSLKGAEVKLTCGALINCTFEIPDLQLKGGSPASLSATEATVLHKGTFCPETSKLSVTYTLSKPTPAYLVEG